MSEFPASRCDGGWCEHRLYSGKLQTQMTGYIIATEDDEPFHSAPVHLGAILSQLLSM